MTQNIFWFQDQSWMVCIIKSRWQKIFTKKMRWTRLHFDHSIYQNSKFLLTFIISLMRENLSKIFLTSLDRIYLLWRVTRVDKDIWNYKILHELLNLISLTNKGSHLFFFRTIFPLIRPEGIPFSFHFYS